MAWLYVPGTTASDYPCDSPYLGIEPSCSLNEKPMQRQSLLRAWRTKPWMRLLSGMTLEPSTADRGVESYRSSLRASPASHSPWPASAGGTPTPGTSGPTSSASSKRPNPVSSSSKTSPAYSQLALLTDAPPPRSSSPTSKPLATRWREEFSQRRKSARRIGESACSSWPTPAAQNWRSGEASDEIYESNSRPLNERVVRWTTPQAHDAQGGNPDRVRRYGTKHGAANLADDVVLWPTPNTMMEAPNSGANAKQWEGFNSTGTLAVAVTEGRFPSSPQAPPTAPPGPPSSPPGPTARPLWQTPSVADTMGGHLTRSGDRSGELLLKGQATRAWTNDPTNEAKKRLNPRFCEWLMNLPIGWTDAEAPIERSVYALWVTVSSRSLERLLSAYSPRGSASTSSAAD